MASLWRRLFAFLLDSLLLGVVGSCLGLVAYDGLANIGGWGLAIGFAIALAYFAAMDSVVFGGQSVGKRVAKIKVTTAAGVPLSVAASALRFSILGIPYFLNGAPVDFRTTVSWPAIVLSLLVFGAGISIVYLFLFNRGTRQSLHDLAVGAYVVAADTAGPVGEPKAVWRVHFVVVSAIFLATMLAPLLLAKLANVEPFVTLRSLQGALQNVQAVRHATLTSGVHKFVSSTQGTTTRHVLAARIVLSQRISAYDALANQLAQIILQEGPAAEKMDSITISISYGFDIGIASAWRTQNYSFSPAQWRTRLGPR
jgi:uncharacterized RDD family membrane protein YckC